MKICNFRLHSEFDTIWEDGPDRGGGSVPAGEEVEAFIARWRVSEGAERQMPGSSPSMTRYFTNHPFIPSAAATPVAKLACNR